MIMEKVFDNGIPEGSIVLIAGEPGTGKTILTSSILHEECSRGKKCMYISFNESDEEYFKNMEKLGYVFRDKGNLNLSPFSQWKEIA